MAGVALDGATISDSTASSHINYRVLEVTGYTPTTYDPITGEPNGGGDPIRDWVPYQTSATIKGKCNASSSSVYVNSKNAVLNGDSTSESDEYSIPNGEYVSGFHSSASGDVTSGNAKNVYISGKLVAVNGSTVRTHASTSATISQGSTNVNIG